MCAHSRRLAKANIHVASHSTLPAVGPPDGQNQQHHYYHFCRAACSAHVLYSCSIVGVLTHAYRGWWWCCACSRQMLA